MRVPLPVSGTRSSPKPEQNKITFVHLDRAHKLLPFRIQVHIVQRLKGLKKLIGGLSVQTQKMRRFCGIDIEPKTGVNFLTRYELIFPHLKRVLRRKTEKKSLFFQYGLKESLLHVFENLRGESPPSCAMLRHGPDGDRKFSLHRAFGPNRQCDLPSDPAEACGSLRTRVSPDQNPGSGRVLLRTAPDLGQTGPRRR